MRNDDSKCGKHASPITDKLQPEQQIIITTTINLNTKCLRIIANIIKDCTNTGGNVAMVTRFCTVSPNVCGSSVTVPAPSILRLILDFFFFCKFVHSCYSVTKTTSNMDCWDKEE
jgi:hypothetical protein